MATRPCLRCSRLCQGTYCPACQSARWAEQAHTRAPRPWYGPGWAKARTTHLATHPTCAWCGSTDRLEVDHIIPRSLAGGLMTLCRYHHHMKTRHDQQGRAG